MNLINEWTKELRYLPYKEWNDSYLSKLNSSVNQSKWRTGFHIQAPTGLLNDPNGFSYYNGEWHLFYQLYPMGPVHGLKSWYHITSKNLVDWEDKGLALVPDNKFDSHGVYSGSAIPIDDKLLLAYTGNVRDENWTRSSFQLGALMNEANEIEKIEIPLIEQSEKYTEHFRDPQVFLYEDVYYLLLGAQNLQLEGKVLTYRSEDLMNWDFLGELAFTDAKMGFMVECPNLIFTNDKAVLLFCPQGLDKEVLDYQNIYPNTYVVADEFDPENNQLVNPTALKNLDEGFDVYATQAFNAPDGRVLEISWVGLPEIAYPSDKEGWAHTLSIVKEITVEKDRMIQRPVTEMKELRLDEQIFSGQLNNENKKITNQLSNRYELNLRLPKKSQGCLTLLANELGEGLELHFDTENGTMKLNRENIGQNFAQDYGVERTFSIDKDELYLQIFVDTSIVEIFVNNGKQVATTRVFPTESQGAVLLTGNSGDFSGNLWTLRSMK